MSRTELERFGMNMNTFGAPIPGLVTDLMRGDPTTAYSDHYEDNPGIRPCDVVTLAQVKSTTEKYVEEIFNNLSRLRDLLDRHETALQRRWSKKTNAQRKKLLLSAWPDMAEHHCPDLRIVWKEKDPAKYDNVKYRYGFMHPQINLEDLTKTKPLLLMFDARSRHSPATFAKSDWNSMEVGKSLQVIKPVVLLGWVMLLRADSYGSLHPHHENSRHGLEDDSSFLPGIGTIILEVQQRLMRFLVTCGNLILHDILFNPELLQQLQSAPPSANIATLADTGTVDLRPSLDMVIQEAPYRVPDRFDFARLQNYVHARRAEAEDHLWALREDPAYFAETVQVVSEQKNEWLRAEAALPESWSSRKTSRFYEEVLRCALFFAYTEASRTTDMCRHFDQLFNVRHKYGVLMEKIERPPKDYEHAIALLERQLQEVILGTGMNLKMAVCASPQLRGYFVPKPEVPGEDSWILRVTCKNIPSNDYFLWIIRQLVNPIPSLYLNGNLLHELQRIMQSDPKQKQRLTFWTAYNVSSLALAYELRRQMYLTRPRPNNPNAIDDRVPDTVIAADFKERIEPICLIGNILIEAREDSAFANMCLPLTKFYYPSDKRQTAATTEAMRKAESHLDSFWVSVDNYFASKIDITLIGLVEDKITFRELHRTNQWTEHRPLSRRQKAKRTEDDTNCVPFLAVPLEERTERIILQEEAPPTKVKAKTRGNTNDLSPPVPVTTAGLTDAVSVVQPQFHLDKRAYKVFSSLFRISTKDGIPGELPWSDFIHGMVSIGFAVQSLDGSASIFSPADGTFGKSIIIHEPHPMSKIPYLIARRIGRRLNRTFGWTAENFVKD